MSRTVRRLPLLIAATLVIVIGTGGPPASGQPSAPGAPRVIASLLEPGEGLTVRATAARSGLVTFAATTGRGLLLPEMAGATALERALAFTDSYGRALGLDGRQSVAAIGTAELDALGQEHVRLRQTYRGIPVTAGEIVVHLRGARVVAVNGHTVPGGPPSVVPVVAAGTARDLAAALLARRRPGVAAGASFSDPRLEVFNRGLLDAGTHPTRLAWFLEATGDQVREFIWIDAASGAVLLHFSQLADARDRAVHDANYGTALPGQLVRAEGEPAVPNDPEVNQAYDFSGLTYDYFLAVHGRDSFDGAGGTLRSSVRYDLDYNNAFWDGAQMVYGEGYTSADDVVAHELTHAITERTANLFYYNQSGALNESYSDIFGEVVDLGNGVGNDAAGERWRIAEDLPIGAIRHMMTPTAFGDPGKMSDSEFVCKSGAFTDPNGDNGGVHSNSGVPNHAFALMVDGGTYNGRTVAGIGAVKAAKIQYRALTTYLTSGSSFADNARALAQACVDLTGTDGITPADCTQVTTAVEAVEMTQAWPCSGAPPTPPPAFCPAGLSPVPFFTETFEFGGGAWTPGTNPSATDWSIVTGFAAKGSWSAWGHDVATTSDHRLEMASAVLVPPGARFYFDHAFEFEHGVDNQGLDLSYDGGVLEYSTDGATWTDAAGLIDGGVTYNGTLSSGFQNPLGGRPAFVRSSFGYTGTRLDLASLAGQNVRFRFRIGTDFTVGSLGWFVDNVQLYACSSGGGFPVANDDGYTTPFETTLSVPAPGLLGNDNANGGGTMTAAVDTTVSSAAGSLVVNGDGSFVFTPAAGFAGRASFTYHVINTKGVSPPGAVTIDVGAQVPAVVADAYATAFGTPLSVSAPGVLGNDSTNGGGTMTAELVTAAANGTAVLAASGAFTYTPAAGFTGADTFSYRAVNGVGPGNTVLVTVLVGAPPAPSAFKDRYDTAFGVAISVAAPGVLGNDTSNGGGPMGASVITPPAHGQLALAADGSFTYTPASGFAGADSFTYRAMNASGPAGAATATATIVVADSPMPLPPSNVRVVAMSGNTVTFAWTLAAAGPAPTSLQLEGGVAPGQVLGAVPLGVTPSATIALPTGSFYVRLRSQANGTWSAPSADLLVHVNVPAPPSPPLHLLGLASGDTLGLSWTPTFSGGQPTGAVLDVSGEINGTLTIGAGEAVSFAGVPPGTYTFAVRQSGAGGLSAASNPVTLTFPAACSGVPQAATNFHAYKDGGVLRLRWDPPVQGAAATGYLLQVGGSFALSVPMSGRSFSVPAPPGTFHLSIVATNACGAGASTAVETVSFP